MAPGSKSAGKIQWLIIVAIGLFAFGFVYRRGVDINWDMRNYHYFFGYSLIHWRFDSDIAPAGIASFYDPIPLAIFYLLLSSLKFPAYAWIIAAMQLSSLPVLVLIAREIDGELSHETPSTAGCLALVLCVAAPLWWSELGTTFYSSTTAPLILLAVLFGLRGVRMASKAQPLRSCLGLAGAAMGLAVGLKLTNGPFAISMALALAMVLFPLGPRLAARHLGSYVIGLVVGFAPTSWWNVYLFERWGSPVFPYYNAIFRAPYFPAINYRNPQFIFHSLSQFVNFLSAATHNTSETVEVNFADARMMMFVVLMVLVAAAWIWKRLGWGKATFGNPMTAVTAAFLWFFSVSFALWALMLAYQRYLIPIELLFGIAIWILVARLAPAQHRVAAAMATLLFVSLVTIKVPDWGHWHGKTDQPNFVGVRIPEELASTPADYLVFGHPTSYVLAFLSPASRFFDVSFNPDDPRLQQMVMAALAADRARPIRLVTFEFLFSDASARLASLGLQPEPDCRHVKSNFDRFVFCNVVSPDASRLPERPGSGGP